LTSWTDIHLGSDSRRVYLWREVQSIGMQPTNTSNKTEILSAHHDSYGEEIDRPVVVRASEYPEGFRSGDHWHARAHLTRRPARQDSPLQQSVDHGSGKQALLGNQPRRI